MLFKIKFQDFLRILKTDEVIAFERIKHPLFYFETETSLFLYKTLEYVTYCSEVVKSSMENLENFKLEYLRDAIELVEMIDYKMSGGNIKVTLASDIPITLSSYGTTNSAGE